MTNFGDYFEQGIRLYLNVHGLKGLGAINGRILNELADKLYADYQAALRREKKKETALDWIEEMEQDPANKGLDVRSELVKAEFWCKNNSRVCTRRFFVGWLLKADRSVKPVNSVNTGISRPDPYKEPSWDWRRAIAVKWEKHDYPDRDLWEEGKWLDVPLTVRNDVLREAYKYSESKADPKLLETS